MPQKPRSDWNRIVFALVSGLIGVYYFWGARAAGYPFHWDKDQPGYYNYLARGFVSGHLYLPVEVSPLLLAQPDPWDPKVEGALKLFDAVLYHGRYYLYHGAGPALMLFAPFRLVTGRDLPENFGLALFCLGGFVFSAGTLIEILRRAGVRPGMVPLTAMLFALGLCQSVPFLLSRVWVYELAIGGGYFCLSAALFCLVRSLDSARLGWLVAAGWMFGMAVACRPHLLIAGALAILALAKTASRKRLLALALPFLLAGMLIAVYNYERFGNPVEFGNKWQLAGENQGRLKLSAANIPPGLYYLLFASPVFSPVFPWVEMPWPPREFPRPPEYFVEQGVGALYLAPFLIALPLLLLARRNRVLLAWLLAAAGGILLFVAMTGWSTQRYEVDFLPLAALALFGGIAEVAARFTKGPRIAFYSLLGLLVLFGCVVNLALGISGPYWEMIRNKPRSFVRIASWFSPLEEHRPVINPRIDVRFSTSIKPLPDHVRQEWVTAARFPYRYELYVEHVAGKPKLMSGYAGSLVTTALESDAPPAEFHVTYSPDAGEIQVTQNGTGILRHKIGTLVSAPSQIKVTVR